VLVVEGTGPDRGLDFLEYQGVLITLLGTCTPAGNLHDTWIAGKLTLTTMNHKDDASRRCVTHGTIRRLGEIRRQQAGRIL
jgi:hypothetical protein